MAPEIDKYHTHKKWSLQEMVHFVQCEKIPKGYLPRTAEVSDC